MDQELKQYLDANFARIDERFAGVDRRFDAMGKDLFARETNLLGAFYGWARPIEIRVDGMTKTVMGFDERLALAERRISE
jgi:hypothetical protein